MLLKLLAALVPMVPMAAKHTTTIKASITAYSTAVGPSSLTKNRLMIEKASDMEGSLCWRPRTQLRSRLLAYVPDSELPTFVNVVFALVPMVPMDAKQTTMIKASITASSTAVGPSSETKNFRTDVTKRLIIHLIASALNRLHSRQI